MVQFDIDFDNPTQNREKVSQLIDQALEKKPDAIILPEMWNTSFNFKSMHKNADEKGEPSLEMLREKASKNNVNIIAGSIADRHGKNTYNRSYVIDRKGTVIFHYDKMHLVHHAKEDQFITPGEEIEIFELDGVKCGIVICYDLRFPELCRALALKGVQVIFAPVQWFETRLDHYEILCKARALENQVYLVSVNRIGSEFKAIFCGKSMVIDPWGKTLAQMNREEGVLTCNLDLSLVDRVRKKVTCFDDRRSDLY